MKKSTLLSYSFLIIAFLFLSLTGWAQQRKISGIVQESINKPLEGATVSVKNKKSNTVTGADGRFTITVPNGKVSLIVSFVGYETETVTVTEGGKDVLVTLIQSATNKLSDVVVIGYGYQKRSDLTGAISTVNAKQLNLGGYINNIGQALEGKVAGVQVIQNSMAPGERVAVRIRGMNSISSNNEPLYVIDGFPSINGADINLNDVESMEILKDASATAIYGARGANGVILITTKRGKQGESHISYGSSTSIQKVDNPFDMLSGKELMLLGNDIYREQPGMENVQYGAYTQEQLKSNINTDWIKICTRPGIVQNHNLQFQGGGEKTRVLVSIGSFSDAGILKNTKYNRISGRVNVDQIINNYLKVGATMVGQRGNSNYQRYDATGYSYNVMGGLIGYSPLVSPYNPDGTFARPFGGKGDNPLEMLLARDNKMVNDKFNGVVYVEAEPIKGLTARINGAAEITYDFNGSYLPKATYEGSLDNGIASFSEQTSTRQLFDAVVTYTKNYNKLHNVSIMGGYSYEKTIGKSFSITAHGFSTDLFSFDNIAAAATISNRLSSKSESILSSFFGRLNYSYHDRYLATFTIRSDGSSRFGKDYRRGLFPSGSIAWRLDQEEFIKNLNVFSNLKFRIGYGKTGNDQIGNYSSLALVTNSHLTFDGTTNTTGTHLNRLSPENSALHWETTSQYNTGFDMGFFNSRLLLTIDAYYKKTTDLLLQKLFPEYSGFVSGQENIGSTENKGFEVAITSRNLINAFKWGTQLNYAMNRNKVLSIGGGGDIHLMSWKPGGNSEEDFQVISPGKSLGSLFGYVYDGVLQTGETYAPQPNSKPGDPKFKDISGPNGVPDGKITIDDRTIIGTAIPKFIYGLTNTFSYKQFDLSIFLHGTVGNSLLNMTRMGLEGSRTRSALNRWTPTHTNTDIPRNGFFSQQYGGFTNSHYIEDASFMRLKNVTFGYTLPLKVKFIESCRLYLMAENLLTITKYSGWNPEVDSQGYMTSTEAGGAALSGLANLYQTTVPGSGIDWNSYPSMKTYTVGLNINF